MYNIEYNLRTLYYLSYLLQHHIMYLFELLDTCRDNIANANEEGVDCGGDDCPPCSK